MQEVYVLKVQKVKEQYAQDGEIGEQQDSIWGTFSLRHLIIKVPRKSSAKTS